MTVKSVVTMAKSMDTMSRNRWSRCRETSGHHRAKFAIKRARTLAREIEKLAPATDRLATPENAEYPWESEDRVIAPSRYEFPSLDLLREPGGRAFLNLIERALDNFQP